jgi:uncharacterized protein (TIGR00255 family)
MTLSSMTGFGRADGALGDAQFHWELRSVNGRSLDVRLRLPAGYDSLEPPVRAALARQVTRGSVTATLVLDQMPSGAGVRVNEAALGVVMAAIERLTKTPGYDRPRPDGVLALKGVLESGSPAADGDLTKQLEDAILAAFQAAVGALAAARASEGARIEEVLQSSIDRIETLVAAIAGSPARRPEAITSRLAELVARLTQASPALDPARLHQEAVLLATRADVEEEIKRLEAHIRGARDLLAEGKPVGRRLDFLSQELNREANTICSKSNDTEITRLGLELKAVIDQVREQVQNIE